MLGDAQLCRRYYVLRQAPLNERHLMAPGESHELFDESVAVGKPIHAVGHSRKLDYECRGSVDAELQAHLTGEMESDCLPG